MGDAIRVFPEAATVVNWTTSRPPGREPIEISNLYGFAEDQYMKA